MLLSPWQQIAIPVLAWLHPIPCNVKWGMCRRNVSFKTSVFVIPKGGLAGGPQPSFVWCDTNYRFVVCSFLRLYCKVGVIPNDGLVGPLPTNPSFGMITTKIFKYAFFVARDSNVKLFLNFFSGQRKTGGKPVEITGWWITVIWIQLKLKVRF